MFGENVDTLNMYVESSYKERVLVWSLTGHQINKWMPAQYSLVFYNPTRLVIEGRSGGGYTGDIAVDDFLIESGPCPSDVRKA